LENKGIDFASIPQTAIKFITSPASFYREMPKKGGFVEPLVFMVAMGVIGGLIQAAAGLLGLNLAGGMAAGVSAIIIVPIVVVIGGFIGAAILFVIWKVMGSQEDYETAYRCGAYASAFSPILAIIGLIPYAGMVVTMLIWVYLIVTASVEVHQIPSGKAWLVFGIIGAIMIVGGVTSQMAAKKFTGQMEETARQMEEATKQMQEEAGEATKSQQQTMPPQGDAGHQTTQAQSSANPQMDEAIKQMEAQMSSMPPEQQAQMRQTIEQMKAARVQAGQ
jgi:hypothetical protein